MAENLVLILQPNYFSWRKKLWNSFYMFLYPKPKDRCVLPALTVLQLILKIGFGQLRCLCLETGPWPEWNLACTQKIPTEHYNSFLKD